MKATWLLALERCKNIKIPLDTKISVRTLLASKMNNFFSTFMWINSNGIRPLSMLHGGFIFQTLKNLYFPAVTFSWWFSVNFKKNLLKFLLSLISILISSRPKKRNLMWNIKHTYTYVVSKHTCARWIQESFL